MSEAKKPETTPAAAAPDAWTKWVALSTTLLAVAAAFSAPVLATSASVADCMPVCTPVNPSLIAWRSAAVTALPAASFALSSAISASCSSSLSSTVEREKAHAS